MAAVHHISRCTIKPNSIPEDAPTRCNLTPWDLALLPLHYVQIGLLFNNPSSPALHNSILDILKDSLSQALGHFFLLAGRLATDHDSASSSSSISLFIGCNGEGVEFIHAAADATVADILTPLDIPDIVKSFFTFDGVVSNDGRSMPLLGVQFTQLVDGFFVGCSFNHSIVDGTSLWNFLNAWSQIAREGDDQILHHPITQRWFGDLDPSLIPISFSCPSRFTRKFPPPPLRERVFHFTPQSVSRLKAKANEECKSDIISSFQALSALMWRCITRARNLPTDQKIRCQFAINNRTRLQPPLSPHYFGNCLQVIGATTTAGELLSHDLGWGAKLLHESVGSHSDNVVRCTLEEWVKAPTFEGSGGFECPIVMIGCSSRFNMYGVDFGWGKPVAIRRGSGGKFDGIISSYPGREGGGSVDLETSLLPEFMNVLELDKEFMEVVSSPHYKK